MSPEKIESIFMAYLKERTDLTEDEKELLDFFKKLLLKVFSFVPIVNDENLNPLVFRHIADNVFPEIVCRFCHNSITINSSKNKGFHITLKDTEKKPIDFYVNQVKSLLMNG